MGKSIYAACVLLQEKYNSDARNIWRRKRSASEVLKRLKEFRGIGEHKAQVGVFLLKNELGIAVGEDDTTLDIRKTCGSLYALYGEGK
jgi:endonuclease III